MSSGLDGRGVLSGAWKRLASGAGVAEEVVFGPVALGRVEPGVLGVAHWRGFDGDRGESASAVGGLGSDELVLALDVDLR